MHIDSALLTGLVTICLFLVKDIVLARMSLKREDKKRETERLRLYIEPLVVSVKKLFWRLDEVFSSEGRGAYLRSDVPNSEYNQYKKASTLYRLASVLGWKRAFRKELSLVNLDLVSAFASIETALVGIEKAMADGSSVELQRLEKIENIWRVDLKDKIPANRRSELAVRVEQILESLDSLETFSSQSSIEATSDLLRTVPEALANLLRTTVNAEIPESTINETRAQIANALCIREAWVYREWQEAIGDIMITEISHSGRRFDVIGFQKFLEICQSGTAGDRKFLHKLERLVDDIDITKDRDSRVQVLWSTYISCAQFVQKVAEAFPETSLLSTGEHETIQKIALKAGSFSLIELNRIS
jgi:hypothetical protein